MSTSAVPVNLDEKLSQFSELWAQKKVATLNDYEVKLAKLKGEFVWHTHEDTDELFLVLSGRLTIQLTDGNVVLGPGELFVVPRGVEHCPVADEETAILLLEPAGTLNTGDAGGRMTKAAEPLS
ncbi:cupin domain-containing protein [Streptomyces purpurogeneiscleroticus]|uniref:cupin domain-containing protein n=1 Tax=Streptomyces purpurogeneiscleroticus TaxID=68259 RepID=UPI001CBF849F|nr:cupin domain-containing protein [Streptomyces purpurogeneiscleroticus]MBZ4020455.1 cupin [Streptomyces purpurogeneiscleroticus]